MPKRRKSREKIVVVLSAEEIARVRAITKSGAQNARVITRARILLLSHEGKTNSEIVAAVGCSPRCVTDVRERYVGRARDALRAVTDAPRPGQPKKILPEHEAYVVATACTNAPEAHAHWTLEALRQKLLGMYVELRTISDERIRQILLKNKLKPWREKNVVRTEFDSTIS